MFPSHMGIVQRAGLILIGFVIFSSISCEEHHLGEYPEVQREQMLPPDCSAKTEAVAPAATATSTPVEFFPEKKSP